MRVPQQLQVNSIRGVMVPWRQHESSSGGMGMAEYLAKSWGLTLKNSEGMQEVDLKRMSFHYVDLDPRDLKAELDAEGLKRKLASSIVTPGDLHYLMTVALHDGLLEPGNYIIVNYP